MPTKRQLYLLRRNFLFWLSRKIDYPLLPPDVLQINFTFRCNLRCRMCSMHERIEFLKNKERPYELEIPVIKKMIKEAFDMGIRSVILIGGEPFLEPRLFELVDFANDCGMQGVTVVTNGTLFSGEAMDKLFSSGRLNLSVSIDAASEDTFAKIRGERVLGKIVASIEEINKRKEALRAHSPGMVSVCTIMDQNLEEIIQVAGLCKRLKINKVIFQPVVGDNTDQARADFNSGVFIPISRYVLLDQAVDSLIEYKLSSEENFNLIANSVQHLKLIKRYFRGKLKPQEMPCYAGYNRLQVVQEGKVYFCVNQDKYESTFGDVNKDSLKELWFSPKAKALRKVIRNCSFPCLQWCAYRDEFIELEESLQKDRLLAAGKEKKHTQEPSGETASSPEKQDIYGFSLQKDWHGRLPEDIPINDPPQLRMDSELRIQQLSARARVQGARILELGCLEGGHSAILHTMGAKEIIAIEGREANFLKCLTVKNALALDRCKFLLGDLDKVMSMLPGRFDICVAIGILYHLHDPVSAIYKIAQLSDSLFVWSHYSNEIYPRGSPVRIVEKNGNVYFGKYSEEDLEYNTSGLHKNSFWLAERDFLKVTQDAGFKDVELISKEGHPHGPALTFFAKK